MLSPAPLPLLCALLLSLPLALIYTTITTTLHPNLTTTTPLILYPSLPTPSTPTLTHLPLEKTADQNPPPIPPIPPIPLLKTPEKTIYNNKGPTLLSLPSPRFAGDESSGDDDDDRELFRLAIRVRVNPNPKRVRKVAFLFLTTSPLPFAPLWEIFFNHTIIRNNNLYNVYIHADPTFNYSTPFTGVFSGRVIPSSKPTRRHSATLIAAARRLIAHALIHDPSNYMFSLLSPSCIPLRSFNFTYRTLMRSRKSFIEILKDEPGAYDRWAARGEQAMLPVVKFEDFRIGSQFFVLKRKHARMVVRDRRLWSKFKLPCLSNDTCYPEEHYFPTLLRKMDPRGLTPATLTHVDWSRSRGGHPRLYRKEEVTPELIVAIRRRKPRYGEVESNGSDCFVRRRHDPMLFARKFEPESLEPLMAIASDVIFNDRFRLIRNRSVEPPMVMANDVVFNDSNINVY